MAFFHLCLPVQARAIGTLATFPFFIHLFLSPLPAAFALSVPLSPGRGPHSPFQISHSCLEPSSILRANWLNFWSFPLRPSYHLHLFSFAVFCSLLAVSSDFILFWTLQIPSILYKLHDYESISRFSSPPHPFKLTFVNILSSAD